MNRRTLGAGWAGGLGDRTRLHGHVGLLRGDRRTARPCARSPAPSISAATSSTPPTCTGRTRTRNSWAARSPAAATRSSWPPSSASRSSPARSPPRRSIDGSPDYVRAACEGSLRASASITSTSTTSTGSTQYADRGDGRGDGGARRRGKVRHLGLSEAGAETIRRATPCTRSPRCRREYSLWTRDVEAEILPTLEELGIALVAYSPLGRGFLSGRFSSPDELDENDFRRYGPRFTGENLSENLKLAERVRDSPPRREITPGQLALAWVLHRGEQIVPIPAPSGCPTSKRTSPPPRST